MGPKTPQSTEKRKRNVLTLPKKIELVRRMEKGESCSKLMAEFGVGPSTLYDFKKQKVKLLSFVASADGPSAKIGKRKTLKESKLGELDRGLYLWFQARRSEGKAVSRPALIDEAKKLKDSPGIEEECDFSVGWLRNFKQRHGIRGLKVQGEKYSADTAAADSFSEEFLSLIREDGVTPEQAYNADETALFWQWLPTSTLSAHTETEAVGFKLNKDRLTILPCANAAGTHECKLFVVGRFKKPRAFKILVHFPIHYDATQSAWMTAALFSWWFHHCFVPEVKQHLRDQGMPEDSKVILILDNCRAHPPAQELVSGNIFAVFLPANVTSLIQPMDQGIIANIKHIYKAAFLRKLVNADMNVPTFQRSFDFQHVVYSVALSWKGAKPSTLQNCWHKLWPTVAEEEYDFEGFDDTDSLSVDQVARLQSLATQAPPSHPIHEVNSQELEEGEPVVHEVTEENIVEMLRTPPQPAQQFSEGEDEQEERERMSWKQGQDHLEGFICFLEQSPHYNASEVMQLHIAYNNFLQKKANSCKQADIRELLLLLSFSHWMSLAPWRTTIALRLAVLECPAHCPSLMWNRVIRSEIKKQKKQMQVQVPSVQ